LWSQKVVQDYGHPPLRSSFFLQVKDFGSTGCHSPPQAATGRYTSVFNTWIFKKSVLATKWVQMAQNQL
jgi:hypothetical protein